MMAVGRAAAVSEAPVTTLPGHWISLAVSYVSYAVQVTRPLVTASSTVSDRKALITKLLQKVLESRWHWQENSPVAAHRRTLISSSDSNGVATSRHATAPRAVTNDN